MTCRIPTRSILALLVAGAAACADSTAPSARVTDSMLTRDVANDAAVATAQDLGEMTGTELLVGMPLASSAQAAAGPFGNCAWNPAVSLFVCPAVTNPDGLTLTRYFEIFAHGASQQSYDATATDSVLFHAAVEGTLTGTDRTAWVHHTRTMMLTGLSGVETQRTWRGAGSRNDSAHVNTDGVARTTRIVSSDAIDNVVYKLPRADFPFPQSGTITHDVTVSATVANGTEETNRHGTRHVVVTFNGTRTASVLVGDTPCTLDLVTRRLACN